MRRKESEQDKLEKRKTREGKEEKSANANKKRNIHEAQIAELFLLQIENRFKFELNHQQYFSSLLNFLDLYRKIFRKSKKTLLKNREKSKKI